MACGDLTPDLLTAEGKEHGVRLKYLIWGNGVIGFDHGTESEDRIWRGVLPRHHRWEPTATGEGKDEGLQAERRVNGFVGKEYGYQGARDC